MRLSDRARASLDAVIERFKAGDLSPITEVARITLPDDAPARKWTMSNRVLAYAQTGSLDCRGYRQWQAVGRQVQKGSTSAYIFGPILVDDEEGGKKLVGFKTIPVFPYHDTQGEGLDYSPKEPPPLMEVAERLGVDVSYGPMALGVLGSARVDGTAISLGTQDPAVWFHELAHIAHRQVKGELQGGQDPHQEATADLTAAVLMDLYGLGDRTGNTWEYISSYNPEDPIRAIMRATDEVGPILDYIFDEGRAQ
jgi:hypothetical protein